VIENSADAFPHISGATDSGKYVGDYKTNTLSRKNVHDFNSVS
jgi:hypothetical protein